MRDHIEARLWADHGHQFSEDLHRLLVGTRDALARLHELKWDAPWRKAQLAAARDSGAPPRLKLAGLGLSAALATIGATIAASGALAPATLALV